MQRRIRKKINFFLGGGGDGKANPSPSETKWPALIPSPLATDYHFRRHPYLPRQKSMSQFMSLNPSPTATEV